MLYSNILAHARRCAPAESCGFVISTPEGERYIPCVNISAEPEAYFRIAPEDWLRAEMQGEIVALVHSHPGGLPWLSEADRRLQIKSALSWWLVCRGEIHKFRCVPHLTGRRFEHGVTDCYTLFRDAYHLAGIDMPDFEREDDWWRNGQNLYLDNMAVTGFYRVPLSSAQAGDILLCCFGASVANHAAIYCGNGELLHHLPEQLSKRRGIPKNGNDERILSGVTATGTYLPSRGFATIGRRLSLYVNTAAEAIRALSLQVPGFRRQMNEGWYQIRIRGEDTAPEAVYARLHEPLGEGAVIHIVPRLAGAGKGGLQIVLGAAAIVGSFLHGRGINGVMGFSPAAGGFSATTMLFSLGASMILGGVAQMLAPKAKTPDYRATDNGRQNTYFSSLDNMIAQGNPMPVPYGEMLVGSRRISQDISTRDEGGGGKVVVIGRQA